MWIRLSSQQQKTWLVLWSRKIHLTMNLGLFATLDHFGIRGYS